MSPNITRSADNTIKTLVLPDNDISAKTPTSSSLLTPKRNIVRIYDNPISTLNDMQLGKIMYTFTGKTGPDHFPTFEVTLDINGCIFKGEGPSKQNAKYDAANKALKRVFQASPTLILKKDEERDNEVTNYSTISANDMKTISSLPTSMETPVPYTLSRKSREYFDNPISRLNNMRLGLVNYCFVGKTGLDHCPIFEVVLEINGYIFKGEGPSKQSAKCDAANKALSLILSDRSRNKTEEKEEVFTPVSSTDSADSLLTLSSKLDTAPVSPDFSSKKNLNIYENPISTLNNMQLGKMNYTFIGKTGLDHCPIFQINLDVNGYTFEGEGSSKKKAKYDAAKKALNVFINFKTTIETNESEGTDQELFNVSSTSSADSLLTLPSKPNTAKYKAPASSDFSSKKNLRIYYENPISTLNDMQLGKINYTFIDKTGLDHRPIFQINLDVNGYTFEGKGSSKRKAKYDAANKALNFFVLSKATFKENGREETDHEVFSVSSTSSDYSSQGSTKKDTVNIRNINIDEKNPISVLNEIRSGLKYIIIDQSGPAHNPTFKISVDVDGQTYFGEGNSKKAAKTEAANEALKSFVQLLSDGTTVLLNRTNSKKMKFTSDQTLDKNIALTLATTKITKGPLMLFNELYPNAEFTCANNDNDPYARFKFTITVRGESFTGSGSNKKSARNAAALAALSKLINYSINSQFPTSMEYRSVSSEDQEKADTVGRLVNEKFSSLMADDLTHIKRKVLAGIVMTRGSSLTDAEVICVTTGTKCVSGEHMSINGASLNDMHAEILTRRCLMNFFYDQLQLLLDPAQVEKSIFVPKPDGKGYKLKKGIEFHLYINTAPCGDARIFSPHEEHPSIDRHPNRSSRGQLRTKIESGEGTIPVKHAPEIQTLDGIIQGERLLTMSCSDKICRWNVLGLQGALLSYFIEPIYLKTIVLGSLMKETHLYRAICGRIEATLQGLPAPFSLNRPNMLRLTSIETRQPQKAPSFSVIWMVGMEKPEIINTFTGKSEEGTSIVAKQNFARRFAEMYQSLSKMITIDETTPTYMEAKEQVHSYSVAKSSLNEAFKKALLGTWISKPIEQDMFDIASSPL